VIGLKLGVSRRGWRSCGTCARCEPLAGPEEIERFETDVVAGFVLARAAAGLSDSTIRGDVSPLEQVRSWFGRPLWDMAPGDADAYFGKVLRAAPSGTRLARAQALKTYFEFVELRHKVVIHQMTGRAVECPIDEMNRPRGRRVARLRIPPTAEQVGQLFAGWRGELATCRKFGPTARNYAASRLMSEVGLRINELRHFCASQLYFSGMGLIAIQETLGHAWIATTMNYVHVHRTHIEDAWITGGDRRRAAEGADDVRWNLRLAAAHRGIWKASELQATLAEHGLVISAGKMSGLWSGHPASLKLDDLDVLPAASTHPARGRPDRAETPASPVQP
jgi:hypothetical protein